MSGPPIAIVAREFYNNIFNSHVHLVASGVNIEPHAINKINNIKNRLNLSLVNDPANLLEKSEINCVRVMRMRGPQLIEAIGHFDIINRYCHPDDCLEEQKQV